MAHDLVAIATVDRAHAEELLRAAVRLQRAGRLVLTDAVVVEKDAKGHAHVHQTIDITPAGGAVTAGFWGLLLGTLLAGPAGGVAIGALSAGGGALLGLLLDRGISADFVHGLSEKLAPGTAAAVFLTDPEHRDDILTELGRFDGTLLWSNLPDEARLAIEQALAKQADPSS